MKGFENGGKISPIEYRPRFGLGLTIAHGIGVAHRGINCSNMPCAEHEFMVDNLLMRD